MAAGARSDVARMAAICRLRVGGRVAAEWCHYRDDHAVLMGTWLRRLDWAPADVVRALLIKLTLGAPELFQATQATNQSRWRGAVAANHGPGSYRGLAGVATTLFLLVR